MGGSHAKSISLSEAQLREVYLLCRQEAKRLEVELATLAERGYHWSDKRAERPRMRKLVISNVAEKIWDQVKEMAVAQSWGTESS